jgi:[acyl-carrier-protein] S-malonyltransferase
MRPPALRPPSPSSSPSPLPSPLSPLLAAAAELERRCEAARTTAPRTLTVSVAAVNSPQQVVLSGHARAVEAIVAGAAASVGIKRAVRLPVSAPFHCAVMAPAEEAVRDAIEGRRGSNPLPLRAPRVPWLSNVDAEAHTAAEDVARLLPSGITRPVRWAESAYAAYDVLGARIFLELGTGTTLAGLVRQVLMSAAAPAKGAADPGGTSASAAVDIRSAGEADEVSACLKHLEAVLRRASN